MTPDLTPDPLLFLIHHATSVTPNMKQSASPAHFRSSVLCYIPHYSPTNTHFLIPAPTLFSIPLWELFPTRLPQVANLTHTRELIPRTAACAGQADLIQSQLHTMPAASWSSTSGSAVLFRFGYWIHFKNQLLNFSLSSKTTLISL